MGTVWQAPRGAVLHHGVWHDHRRATCGAWILTPFLLHLEPSLIVSPYHLLQTGQHWMCSFTAASSIRHVLCILFFRMHFALHRVLSPRYVRKIPRAIQASMSCHRTSLDLYDHAASFNKCWNCPKNAGHDCGVRFQRTLWLFCDSVPFDVYTNILAPDPSTCLRQVDEELCSSLVDVGVTPSYVFAYFLRMRTSSEIVWYL